MTSCRLSRAASRVRQSWTLRMCGRRRSPSIKKSDYFISTLTVTIYNNSLQWAKNLWVKSSSTRDLIRRYPAHAKDTSSPITIRSMSKPRAFKQCPIRKSWEVRVEYREEQRMGRSRPISDMLALLKKIEWITRRMSLWLSLRSHLQSDTQPRSVTSMLGRCPSKNTIRTSGGHTRLKNSLQWCNSVERWGSSMLRRWRSWWRSRWNGRWQTTTVVAGRIWIWCDRCSLIPRWEVLCIGLLV